MKNALLRSSSLRVSAVLYVKASGRDRNGSDLVPTNRFDISVSMPDKIRICDAAMDQDESRVSVRVTKLYVANGARQVAVWKECYKAADRKPSLDPTGETTLDIVLKPGILFSSRFLNGFGKRNRPGGSDQQWDVYCRLTKIDGLLRHELRVHVDRESKLICRISQYVIASPVELEISRVEYSNWNLSPAFEESCFELSVPDGIPTCESIGFKADEDGHLDVRYSVWERLEAAFYRILPNWPW